MLWCRQAVPWHVLLTLHTLVQSLNRNSIALGWVNSTAWLTSITHTLPPDHSRLYSLRSPCTSAHLFCIVSIIWRQKEPHYRYIDNVNQRRVEWKVLIARCNIAAHFWFNWLRSVLPIGSSGECIYTYIQGSTLTLAWDNGKLRLCY
jgi:hypothetical protein